MLFPAVTNCPQPPLRTGRFVTNPQPAQGFLVTINSPAGDALRIASPFSSRNVADCNCSSAQAQYLYLENQVSPVVQESANDDQQHLVSCSTGPDQGPNAIESSPCVCDESGDCFEGFGALTTVPARPGDFFTFLVHPFCDTGGCHIYVAPLCLTFGDPNSGVRSTTTGRTYACSDFLAPGMMGRFMYTQAGSNSPYIKASVVSCRGCTSTCQQCSGPTNIISNGDNVVERQLVVKAEERASIPANSRKPRDPSFNIRALRLYLHARSARVKKTEL